jgi:YesN/AraC family two-component response regulator
VIFKIIIQKLISKTKIFDNVETLSNGEEAFVTIKNILNKKEQLLDIILLDIEKPIMDGWAFIFKTSVLKKIRRRQNKYIYTKLFNCL